MNQRNGTEGVLVDDDKDCTILIYRGCNVFRRGLQQRRRRKRVAVL